MNSTGGITIVDVGCPLCGSDDRQPILEELEDVEDRVPGRYVVSFCVSCGLIYLSRRPTPESLPLCYPAHYHIRDPVRRNLLPRFLYGLRLQSRYRRLRNAVGSNCHALLEIGCGDGSLLRLLDEKLPGECVLTGIDLSVPQTDSVRHPRLTFVQGEFEKVDFPVKYDAVVMLHVLEHLADPLASLKKISHQLQTGGVLLGEVPSWSSLWRRVFPRHWQGLAIPRHQIYFDALSLRNMLSAAGYDVIHITPSYDPGDLSVTLCNWITDTLKLRTPSRQAWFYFPTAILSAPIVWLANIRPCNSGAIQFAARKR
ncbi:MAG: class I SAM-dependent methyltransferase [Verrucomicrobiia bacterium]|jgi:SAM-dependent methyltransferase